MNSTRATTGDRTLQITLIIGGATFGWAAILVAILTQASMYTPVGIAGLIVFGASWIAGRVLTRDIAEGRADRVDEYEFDQRAQVRNVGYVLALGAMVATFLLLSVAVKLAERGNTTLLYESPYLVFAAYLLAAAVPTFLMAWRDRNRAQRDDDLEDPDEGALR